MNARPETNQSAYATIGDIKSLLEGLKEDMLSSLRAEIRGLKDAVTVLNNRVNDLEQQFDSMKHECHQNRKESTLIREDISNYLESEYREDIFNEMEQRYYRRKNVIMVGIPEVNEGSVTDRHAKDWKFVHDVCQKLEVQNAKIKHVQRIGQKYNNRPRLLKVTCSLETRGELLRKSIQLRNKNPPFNGIYINIDRTRMQQHQFRYQRQRRRRRFSSNDNADMDYQLRNF